MMGGKKKKISQPLCVYRDMCTLRMRHHPQTGVVSLFFGGTHKKSGCSIVSRDEFHIVQIGAGREALSADGHGDGAVKHVAEELARACLGTTYTAPWQWCPPGGRKVGPGPPAHMQKRASGEIERCRQPCLYTQSYRGLWDEQEAKEECPMRVIRKHKLRRAV